MTADILFEGGHIFNNKRYPAKVMTHFIAMQKQMGKNVELKYATVDVAGATRDLSSIGFSLRQISSIDTFTGINPSLIENRLNGLVKDYFEEDIMIVSGDDVISSLIQHTIDNQVAQYKDNFFTSSSGSEGNYYSYQLTFYSMRKASFCFIVLSFISFKDQETIFGIPSKFTSGVSYNAQVFEVKKIFNNVLYNFGILRSGESLGSPNGQHKAPLSNDGNLKVDERWQSNSAGKGQPPPYYLAMQEDANLVIYDKDNRPTWASGSQPGKFSSPPFRLELQDDGNLVVYDQSDRALWAIW